MFRHFSPISICWINKGGWKTTWSSLVCRISPPFLMSTEPFIKSFVIILKTKLWWNLKQSHICLWKHYTVWFCCRTFCSLPSFPQDLSLCPPSSPFVLAHADCSFSSSFVSTLSFSSPFEPLSVCPIPFSPYPLSQPFSVIALPSFCLSHRGFIPLHCISLTSKMPSFYKCILPSDPFPTSLHPSLCLSCVTVPSLPPEIITTSFVRISLYLNSWISKASGCWQSLFNNNEVKQWSRK